MRLSSSVSLCCRSAFWSTNVVWLEVKKREERTRKSRSIYTQFLFGLIMGAELTPPQSRQLFLLSANQEVSNGVGVCFGKARLCPNSEDPWTNVTLKRVLVLSRVSRFAWLVDFVYSQMPQRFVFCRSFLLSRNLEGFYLFFHSKASMYNQNHINSVCAKSNAYKMTN